MSFGSTLARFRRDRGWSQEALSLRADVSQRHLSFLETGRAQPGQSALVKLTAALALKGWEQRALLQTLAPAPKQDEVLRAGDGLPEGFMEKFSTWPAYAFKPDGSLVAANSAMQLLLKKAAADEDLWLATAPKGGPNIYDLVFHPRGLVRWMENPDEVVPETLRRLRIEAAYDGSLRSVLHRMEQYPSAERHLSVQTLAPAVLIERYSLREQTIAIISVLSHLASPGELELDILRIESFVPADEETAAFLSSLRA